MPAVPGTTRANARDTVLEAADALRGAGLLPDVEIDRDRAPLVRRSGRRASGVDDLIQASLYQTTDGALVWRESPAPVDVIGRRGRYGAGEPAPGDHVVTIPLARLEPNRVTAFIAGVDTMLNDRPGLRRIVGGRIQPDPIGRLEGRRRRLLFVHGTFSKTGAFLDGIAASPDAGKAFWSWAAASYDEILCFDHPTLSVSPILNALDLLGHFAGATGPLDVIAHSRGGLITRWFLDGFGAGGCGPCRAVVVGVPLAGTSLAAPPRLRAALGAITSYGQALKMAGDAATPFLPWVAGATALVRVVTSITGTLSSTPVIDAAVCLIPGLAGQSRVGNNEELRRLHALVAGTKPTQYFAIRSNFESDKPGWRFWKWFRLDTVKDAVTDGIFDGDNDLVVDTGSMDDVFGAGPAARIIHDFGTSGDVHHTNYFRQKETLAAICKTL